MSLNIWEDFVSINSRVDKNFEILGPAKDFADDRKPTHPITSASLQIPAALERDTYALPLTDDREGYFGPDHYGYWLGGLTDWSLLKDKYHEYSPYLTSYLDIGCASGRVIRHAAVNDPHVRTFGCDINRAHVDWCMAHLPASLIAFHTTSVPSLPLEDNSLDLVSAYSVFSHIEAFETAWLMEIRRVLRPGGIAWVTVHTDDTLRNLSPSWPVYDPVTKHPEFAKLGPDREMPTDRLVFRWHNDRSYSSNVFYRRSYINRNWGRILKVAEFIPTFPNYQDVLILQKT